MIPNVDQKIFHDFHFRLAMPMRIPQTSRKIIEEFVDIDVNSDMVSKIIGRNQYVKYMLMKQIEGMGLKGKSKELDSVIVMFGMEEVRDFVCALQILRTVGGKHPQVGPDGRFGFKTADVLKYALRTEEYVKNRKFPYADSAYAAGMMFDRMVAIGADIFNAPKSYFAYVDDVYKHGLMSARIGYEVAREMKGFGFSKVLFASCLVHDIGKLVMELLYAEGTPNAFKQFRLDIEKKPLTRDLIHFIETARFGFTHEYYSSQLVWAYEIFRIVERAILFHHDPYLIRSSNKDTYNLACLIALASNMARKFQKARNVNDSIMKHWLSPELKDFAIDPRILVTTMEKLDGETF
ncbi:MAG: HD domain-containing protein [Deltaproteobacteria bacterium]|nr:HD domain-containing protein [Deltaproteobacteria bacterium]